MHPKLKVMIKKSEIIVDKLVTLQTAINYKIIFYNIPYPMTRQRADVQ